MTTQDKLRIALAQIVVEALMKARDSFEDLQHVVKSVNDIDSCANVFDRATEDLLRATRDIEDSLCDITAARQRMYTQTYNARDSVSEMLTRYSNEAHDAVADIVEDMFHVVFDDTRQRRYIALAVSREMLDSAF